MDGLGEEERGLVVSIWLIFYTDCARSGALIEDYTDDLGFEEKVEVGVFTILEELVIQQCAASWRFPSRDIYLRHFCSLLA